MIEIILLVILIVLNGILLLDKLPVFARLASNERILERNILSARNDVKALTNQNRLLRANCVRYEGKIAGLEIELENATREAAHWKAENDTKKKVLEQFNIRRGE